MLANLIGFLGDFDLAEEAAQEAFAVAAQRWPREGTPPNPGAWLTAVAKRRAIDHLRRAERADRAHEAAARDDVPPEVEPEDESDVLRLMFLSCHPVLPTEGRLALTLRLLGGLGDHHDGHGGLLGGL